MQANDSAYQEFCSTRYGLLCPCCWLFRIRTEFINGLMEEDCVAHWSIQGAVEYVCQCLALDSVSGVLEDSYVAMTYNKVFRRGDHVTRKVPLIALLIVSQYFLEVIVAA